MHIVQQVAEALAYLHAADIVHRDVKSSNVLLATRSLLEPLAKLGDFGLSRRLSGTMTPEIGTVGYLAPEKRSEDYGPGADVFSLGVLIYEIFTKERPHARLPLAYLHRVNPNFRSLKTQDLRAFEKVLARAIVLAQQEGWTCPTDGVPACVAGIMDRCLSYDHRQRPPASSVASELQGLNSLSAESRNRTLFAVADPPEELLTLGTDSGASDLVPQAGTVPSRQSNLFSL
jgi:serine/threonine protein kinase